MSGRASRSSLLVISGSETDRRWLVLTAAGAFRVAAARDGDEAIDILSTRSFDVVVLDLTLPRLRGTDVLAYYHGRYPEGRNVVVTGDRAQLDAIDFDAVFAVVPKPFDRSALVAVLRECAREQTAA